MEIEGKSRNSKLLLVIDPQVDFVTGSLPVKGAVDDMYRIANHIATHEYDHIIVSLDWHNYGHIASVEYWSLTRVKKQGKKSKKPGKKGKKQGKKQGKKGKKQGKKQGKKGKKKGMKQGKKQGKKKGMKQSKKTMKMTKGEKKLAFTMVMVEKKAGKDGKERDVLMGKKADETFPIYTRNASKTRATISYIKKLNQTGHVHMIWPRHCIQGTAGARVHPILDKQLKAWSFLNNKRVEYVRKGSNNKVEHFSMFKACVSDPKDKKSGLNKALLNKIMQYKEIDVCGEAMDYCVLESLKDLYKYMHDRKYTKTAFIRSKDSEGHVTMTERELSDIEKKERVMAEWSKIHLLRGGMSAVTADGENNYTKWVNGSIGLEGFDKPMVNYHTLTYSRIKPAQSTSTVEYPELWTVKKNKKLPRNAEGYVFNPVEVLSDNGNRGQIKQEYWKMEGAVHTVTSDNGVQQRVVKFTGGPTPIPGKLEDKPIYKGYWYGNSGNSLFSWSEVQVFLVQNQSGSMTIDSVSDKFQRKLFHMASKKLKSATRNVEKNGAGFEEVESEMKPENNATMYSSDEDSMA